MTAGDLVIQLIYRRKANAIGLAPGALRTRNPIVVKHLGKISNDVLWKQTQI